MHLFNGGVFMPDDFMLLIRFVYFSLEREKHMYFEQQNLTASQGDVLLIVAGSKMYGKDVNQRDIETHLRLTNPTVTGILTRLEDKDFITRVKSQTDGRNNLIHLTPNSEAILDQFRRYKDKIDAMLLAGMDEQEREQFRQLLQKVLHNMNCDKEKKK